MRRATTGARPWLVGRHGRDTCALVVAVFLCLALAACRDARPPTPTGPSTTAPPTSTPPATASLASLTIAPASVLAGLDATATVELTAPAPDGGRAITLAADHDAALVSATLTVPAGSTQASTTIATRDVTAAARVMITATDGTTTAEATLDIAPVPREAEGFSIEPDRIHGGQVATGRIVLGSFASTLAQGATQALDPVVVTLTSSHPAASVPPFVTVPAGETEATFSIDTREVPSLVVLQLTATAGGHTRTTGLRVLPAAPTLTSLTPGAGTAGTSVDVTLDGTGFIPDDTTVTVGGAAGITVGQITVVNATRITARLTLASGTAAGTYPVTVTTSGGTSESRPFIVHGEPPPTLASIAPASQSRGTTAAVTLTGTNFVNGDTTVNVSGSGVTVSNVVVVSATSVTANFVVDGAAALGARTVTVTTSLGTSGGQTFTVTAGSATFDYNGTDGSDGTSQTFTVPSGVTSIDVEVEGGEGGRASSPGGGAGGGRGGSVTATIAVTPGETLTIYAAGRGLDGGLAGGDGGFNGGGDAGGATGGGGGGASEIRRGTTQLVVAGGGGGGGQSDAATNRFAGGHGGGLTGQAGEDASVGGGAGTQAADGQPGNAVAGNPGQSGFNGTGGDGGAGGGGLLPGGGGGAGYFGGAGGHGAANDSGGGGGGSSFTVAGATGVTHQQGVRAGHGRVVITW